jgi:hypothetical protein
MAQARDLFVSDVRGTVQKSTGVAAPVRLLDAVRTGERLRLSSDSQVTIYSPAGGLQFVVDGPAEVAVSAKGVLANGKAVDGRRVDDAYRSVKVNPADMVQGSLVMRAAATASVVAPQGVVTAADARVLTWTGPGAWVVEVARESGDLVYRAEARGGRLELPAVLQLQADVTYVWGLRRAGANTEPVDWTEFRIAEAAPEKASRALHAMWLRENGMPRAALRELQAVR